MCSFLILPLEIYNKYSKKQIEYLNRKLKLRGPDLTNIVIHNGYVFIHNLLHICGVVTPQPFIENNIVIIYNGEIYNYKEFGDYKSDGECLMKLYREKGENFIKELDGEFGIVIFDFNKNNIIISSDIFALKPIWYYTKESHIIISTFESPIEEIINIKGYTERSINISQRENMWKKNNLITKNKPNEFIILDLNSLEIKERNRICNFDLKQYKEDYEDWFIAFEKAIKKRALQNINRTISIALSSGYDSGCIACALDNLKIKYDSYTITATENVNTIKKRINTHKNYMFTLSEQEYSFYKKQYQTWVEGSNIKHKNTYYNTIGDWAGVGLHYIFSKARKNGSYIFLSGTGGDEIYSDYGYKGINMKNNNKIGPGTLSGLYPNNLSDVFPWENFFNGLMECFIAKEENAGSLKGIEVRYPFLDREVVQEFLWLKSELKNNLYKAPLHKYMEKYNYPFDINSKIGFKAKNGLIL
jgi:asparagine synthetase B (glutamine-hydrolysing)